MGPSALRRFAHSRPGRPFLYLLRTAIRFARRRTRPEIPDDQTIKTFQCCGRAVRVRHRPWDRSDRLCLKQCFFDQQYDMPAGAQGEAVQRFYNHVLASGRKPLIIDCGANIGASALWFAARYPAAHIIAIEPALDNFELLQYNCVGLDHVETLAAAVGPVAGCAYLSDDMGNGMAYRVVQHTTDLPVRIVTIRDLLPDPGLYEPFLLKIDIEGGEMALFAGDTSAIDLFPVILMEPHDWLHPGCATSHSFFSYHAKTGREFSMKDENLASLDWKRLISALT